MKALKHFGSLAILLATLGSGAERASASLVINSSVGGAPTGVDYVNFNNLALGSAGGTSGGLVVSFTSGNGAVVQGSASGLYAAPYLSGGNGTLFGNPGNGADTTRYLSTGIGTITLTLPGLSNYFGLLWGSVDTYNTLELFNGKTLVGTVTGSNVTAGADGDQGANGTFYVNINSDLAFNTVELISSQYAFELDNVAYNTTAAVPEPASIALFGAGLLAFGWLYRRKTQSASM